MKNSRQPTFLGILFLSKSCKFYYDDITVTSIINIKHGDITIEKIPQGTAFFLTFIFSGRIHMA